MQIDELKFVVGNIFVIGFNVLQHRDKLWVVEPGHVIKLTIVLFISLP